MNESRTQNSIKNVGSGFFAQFVNKIMAFIVRTVFIYCLNTDYLGANGLFTNVISLLSFAELGIGTAIIYNMYKPVSEGDNEKIKSLLQLYKKTYNCIALVVLIIGVALIPFLDFIIGETPHIKENIVIIYLLFVINVSVSYLFTYKKSIIIAYQKQSIINYIDGLFFLVKSLVEIAILLITHNYIIYLLIIIFSTLIENLVIYKKADYLYPYLAIGKAKELDKKEKEFIFSNIKSLAVYQFGSVILNGTDNIIISAMINLSTVGLVSNYTLVITSIKGMLINALNNLTASIGNLNTLEDKKKKENILNQLTFLHFVLYSIFGVGVINCLNPFISIWLGKNFLLNNSIIIALVISFFIEGIRQPCFMFRTTLGIFQKSQITPYIGAITNVVVSIILCKYIGLVGVFIATSIAQILSYVLIDPYLIYRYEFHSNVMEYYRKLIVYFGIFILQALLTYQLCNLLNLQGIKLLFANGIISIFISAGMILILFYKSSEMKGLVNRIKNLRSR